MYCNPCHLDDYPGLGQMRVTAYQVGSGPSHPCQDFSFKLRNREACARMGYNGTPTPAEQKAAPPPPPPEPYIPEIIVEPPPRPLPPPVEAFVPDPTGEEIPPEEFIAPDPGGTVISVPGGGGGWGPDSPAAQLSVGPTEVFVEAEEGEGPGFGIIEVALAAGVAWVLSQSYQRRRRR